MSQRLIDKDVLLEELKKLEASGGSKEYRRALNDALHYFFPKIINELPTITPPPNDPLTIKELLEMDGEPVWDNTGNCFIVRINVAGTDGYGVDKFATYTKLDILCERGLYRRKPEEGANATT